MENSTLTPEDLAYFNEHISAPPDPPMTPEEIEAGWKQFLALASDLKGKRVEYGCLGGDMYRIRATVEAVYCVSTDNSSRVIIDIAQATQSPDEGSGLPEKWEPFLFPALHLDLLDEPPKIHGKAVVLPATIDPIDVSLEIGFIFL